MLRFLVIASSLALAGAACNSGSSTSTAEGSGAEAAGPGTPGSEAPAEEVVGSISIDGSSTVYPITEAVAEEYREVSRSQVTIGVSGTGGGFQKFCRGEIHITGASRPIRPTEAEACGAAGIEYVELPVAYDGIAVVVNPANTWVDHLTVAELKRMWEPAAQGTVMRWNQIRPEWPDEEIHLFGPGIDSGTYDYFTAAIVEQEHASRGDFTSSEDDNVLVQGVGGDRLALGFFGYAYYVENQSRVRAVPIDDGDAANGAGPIAPTLDTVGGGTYQPLSRPVFIYVSKAAAELPFVDAFMDFYLDQAAELSAEVGYIPLPPSAKELVIRRFDDRVVGSVFGGGGSRVGVTVEELLRAE